MKLKVNRRNLCSCGSRKKPDKCCAQNAIAGVTAHFKPESSNPDQYQKAMDYHKAGELEKAEMLYRELLCRDTKNPNIYLNLGQIYENKGRFDDALHCYKEALKIKPDFDSVFNNIGIIFLRQEKLELAKEYFEKTLSLNPNIPEAWNNFGILRQRRKEYGESEICFQKAISQKSDYADAYNNLGGVYIYQGKRQKAIDCFQKAISLDPSHAGAYNNIGNIYRFNDQLKEAESYYLRAIKIQPRFPDAHNNLGNIYGLMGRIDEAIASYKIALNYKPDYKEAQSNLLLNLNYSSKFSPEEIFAEHQLFDKRFAEPLKTTIRPHQNVRSGERKLRIGYLSPDFRSHSVDSFLEPVLSNHDSDFFEVFCYSNSTIWDHMTRQLHSYADHWRIIPGLSDQLLAELIRGDQIDILIDLCGHTAHNRMTVFARKPAPIQVTWLGYPNTSGLSAMDYRITDPIADPVGMTERYHSEKLVRLPECFSCFRAPDESPDVEDPPAAQNGRITFGSFNLFAKVTPQVIGVWSEILKEVPTSRLILKTAGLNDEEIKKDLYGKFAHHGIPKERIDLLGKDPSRRDHFQKYHKIDIGLDPFPYNGTTTTCDALWMGVPVITLEGKTHVGRVGVGQLTNLGLTELIAKTVEQYVEIAKRLSSDINHLRELRLGMRSRMSTSPLMAHKRFTKNLEKAYREMWKEFVSQNAQKLEEVAVANTQAQKLLTEGKLTEAEKIYQNILLADPQNIDALHDLGIVAFQARNFKKAAEFFIKALSLKPDNSVAQNNLGVAFYELNLKKEAKNCYETAISLKPDYAEAYFNLGILFRDQKDATRAAEYFHKALVHRPGYLEAKDNLNKLSPNLTKEGPGLELNQDKLDPDDVRNRQ